MSNPSLFVTMSKEEAERYVPPSEDAIRDALARGKAEAWPSQAAAPEVNETRRAKLARVARAETSALVDANDAAASDGHRPYKFETAQKEFSAPATPSDRDVHSPLPRRQGSTPREQVANDGPKVGSRDSSERRALFPRWEMRVLPAVGVTRADIERDLAAKGER